MENHFMLMDGKTWYCKEGNAPEIATDSAQSCWPAHQPASPQNDEFLLKGPGEPTDLETECRQRGAPQVPDSPPSRSVKTVCWWSQVHPGQGQSESENKATCLWPTVFSHGVGEIQWGKQSFRQIVLGQLNFHIKKLIWTTPSHHVSKLKLDQRCKYNQLKLQNS